MRKLDILTSQNVSIQYTLPSLGTRLLSFIIDSIVIAAGAGFLSFIFIAAFGKDSFTYFNYFVNVPIFFFYTLLMEYFNNGQTLGKMAMGLKIVKINGKNLEFYDYIIRWMFRMVDIYLTFGSLGAILISSSERGQRLGELLSDTTVISINPDKQLSINDILNIRTIDKYTPVFPQITHLSESDLIVIKNVIERHKKHPNDAHKLAIDNLCKKLEDILGIKPEKLSKVKFLETLLKDYVVLTR